MKSRTWAMILALIGIASLGLSLWLFRDTGSATAQIRSDGELLYVLDLTVDQEVTVTTDHGSNTVTVRDGKLAVTGADCPDGWCMAQGWCDSGRIVCLPNRLVISFSGDQELDGVVGR